jgi:hypothetical protein
LTIDLYIDEESRITLSYDKRKHLITEDINFRDPEEDIDVDMLYPDEDGDPEDYVEW